MRKILSCGLFFAVFALPFASQADAAYRSGGWCLVYSLGRGSVSENCSFRSFEACQGERIVFGSSAFCRVSQYPAEGPPRRLKKNRSKYRT
ncbi:MAG: hypothetical protein K2Y27_22230 [Xanthobacteraceae bacterium]|nr:hypothetical protein [Xanthobacteraceae bacterium]